MTTRTPEQRARELSGPTGVPTRFEVLYEEHVVDCALAEKLIHKQLADFRLRQEREFFEVPLKLAVRAVFEACLRVNEHLLQEDSRLALYIDGGLPKEAMLTELVPSDSAGKTRLRLILSRRDSHAELDLGDGYLVQCTPELVAKLQRQPWIKEVVFYARAEA